MTCPETIRNRHFRPPAALVVLLLTVAATLAADGPPLKSPSLVAQLVQVMTERQLTAVAVQHSSEPDRFVAAMLFPGVQLLVITAQTPAQDYLQSQLTPAGYSNVYLALQNGIAESKLFIQDMGADGLRGTDGGVADIVYVRGKHQHVLNGDHKAANMSREAYARVVADLDGQYTQLLSMLIPAAGAGSAR